MEVRLLRHLAERDVGFARLVAAALAASLADRHESMQLNAVARYALKVLECARVGLQMHAVSRCRCDTLPGSRVLRDVTGLADFVWHFRVLADLLRPFRDPQVELPHT